MYLSKVISLFLESILVKLFFKILSVSKNVFNIFLLT